MSSNGLFEVSETDSVPKIKKPRLGRYERIRRDLETSDDIHKKFVDVANLQIPLSNYTFADLFCGAGGMTQGFVQAGLTPLISVEVSPVAMATHIRNFPQSQHFCGDIAKFDAAAWVEQNKGQTVHVVSGGPPCQGFSVAGKRDPDDPRNRLFRQFVRIVSELRPWYIVMENVPGILTMQKGAVKEAICETFSEAGYPNVSIAVLESAEYGVPQIRPRAIFIANRFGLRNPFPQPQRTPDQYAPIESAISDLPAYTPQSEINHEWTKHSKAYMERIAKVPAGGSLYETFFDAFKRQYPGLPSMTIKENHGGTHIHPHLNRVISAREMARLQTFPDTFFFEGTMKKAMWQIGNAVPPRLAECIGCALIPSLNQIHKSGQASPARSLSPIQQESLRFD